MILRNAWRRNNIGRRMNEAVRIFENRIIEHLKIHGHAELTSAHINLTRNLDEDGTRLTELARRASLTKQSMSELVDQVERTGLIEKRPDPADGRAKLVCFTDKGFEWLEAFHQSLDVAENEMRNELGVAMVDLMVEALGKYVEGQHGKDSDAAG
ncbi:DNA-binding MarR family transcriptional regulator [Rhizobium leguminosarum]|uniref:DNA-binding MarR family transcriptional regulator n=2 Tax=Rhizobium/Agrobacterium group TaxID=227290 RepID=A0AAE2MGX2_RHILE|nr:DNA-binding MarR family transcriptional regulator [Rhizobium leguminosarum]MBB4433084.1 DNA-binding MarR family transcriptional regulator [Rhizobium esperanzae]MBB4294788.1 DNA-binding MarR family transcriptional regulator [Rhizobium leguminosarum]MBB4306181.1 DNA-binding MarR family transcriptional regulator [Rhizobium leguminosarum]MBB4418239.1 DNA-binding MarR family transcriptional regulator [Rhizobium leguminosarum]